MAILRFLPLVFIVMLLQPSELLAQTTPKKVTIYNPQADAAADIAAAVKKSQRRK